MQHIVALSGGKDSTAESPITRIGRCGYSEPTDEGAVECCKSGLRLTVRDPLGFLRSIIRCRQHSDWVNALREDGEHCTSSNLLS